MGLTKVGAMMTKASAVHRNTDIVDGLRRLAENKHSDLAVVDEKRTLLGSLSEELVVELVATGGQILQGTVERFMTNNVATISSNVDIGYALGRFRKEGRESFLVVEDGKLLGRIRRRDILARFMASAVFRRASWPRAAQDWIPAVTI